MITKIKLRLARILGFRDKTLKIRKGPLSGLNWSLKISDHRYLSGDYETDSTLLLMSRIKKGDVVFDVGANAGYFTLLFSRLTSPDKVFAFEPLPENIDLLSLHLRINEAGPVTIFPYAVADKSGEIVFSDSGNPSANTYKTESSVFDPGSSIKVKAVSLDDMVFENSLPMPDFMKIDVEGAELDVLKGAARILEKKQTSFLLATHDCHVPGIEKQCLEYLESIGYKAVSTGEAKEIKGQNDYFVSPG